MTIDIQGLNEKTLQVLHNSDEFVRRWIEFISAPAGTVNLEYYDENGNVQTVAFSNRNKLVQDFIANVSSAMSKTFYVDAVNGDDNNDGSYAAPFATSQKAVDSVPSGGVAEVFFLSDYVLDSAVEKINSENKKIYLHGQTTANLTIKQNTNENVIRGSGIFIISSFNNVTFEFNATTSAPVFWSTFRYHGEASSKLLYVEFTNCAEIVFRNNETTTTKYVAAMVDMRITSSDIITDTGVILLSLSSGATSRLEVNGVTATDANGASVDIASLIANIIKDANGVPRNIVSNLIL